MEIDFINIFMYGYKELILHTGQLDCIKVPKGKHKFENRCMNKSTKLQDLSASQFVIYILAKNQEDTNQTASWGSLTWFTFATFLTNVKQMCYSWMQTGKFLK